MKKSNDNIGNQTRDLPACSAVPHPTAPPRDPHACNKWKYVTTQYTESKSKIKQNKNYTPFGTTFYRVSCTLLKEMFIFLE